jgi:uncharacterized protein (DUF1330 family)
MNKPIANALFVLAVGLCTSGCVIHTQISPPASTPPAVAKGYAIAEIAVNDSAAYREYVAAVTPLVAKHGGVYLVRGGAAIAKEGASPQGRLVVIEFPSYAAAQAFYQSAEYQAVLHLRVKAATSRVLIVEGAATAGAAR